MKKTSRLNDYLNKYAAEIRWTLQCRNLEDIEQVVVIPAYAEKTLLFATLASLAANDNQLLARTLILCVINNKATAPDADKENNAQTLAVLDALIQKKPFSKLGLPDNINSSLQTISESSLRLGYIDASSKGMEIPSRVGGVGMARKIGMDAALRLMKNQDGVTRLILSLDADTVVQSNYLSAVRDVFSSGKTQTGIVAYEHQMPEDAFERAAICSYEIFLRYWVLGLWFAQSPYAFHSIGSTMVTTVDGYLAVRGMNRREAGEDFYFLNKLAKISFIRQINETVVYPSARISRRVPFGTGAAVGKIFSSPNADHSLYDPRIFIILKEWIALMRNSFNRSEREILADVMHIDAGLKSFLITRNFLSVWPKIRRNVNDKKTYERQFHAWFDGFETLKLVNYLSRKYYPQIGMLSALQKMMQLLWWDCPVKLLDEYDSGPGNETKILLYLRDRASNMPVCFTGLSS